MSDGTSTATGVGPLVPADGQWHFVAALVWRSASSASFWVDGQALAFNTVPVKGIPLNNGSGLTIGSKNDPPSPPAEVFNGCIDEVEIFNRALSSTEINNLRSAGSNGKFKFTAQLPSIGFCPGDATVNAAATICNRSAESDTFYYGLRGLLAGCGTLSGPLVIGNSPNSVTIGPWQCQDVTFTVPRPAGLVPGKSGCVVMEVYAQGRGEAFSTPTSTVYPVQSFNCFYAVSWQNVGLALSAVPHGTFTSTNIELANLFGTNLLLNYRIRVAAPDGTNDTRVISLNGLPPGTPVTNSVMLAPGASTTVAVNGQLIKDIKTNNDRIWYATAVK